MSFSQRICTTCPAWKKSLFSNLNDQELTQLAQIKAICNLQKNEVLFKQGQTVEGLYCNADGLVKVVQTEPTGQVKFSRLVYPGDTAGHRSIFIESTYKSTASVLSDSLHCCFISKENVLRFFFLNHDFAKKLITKLAIELDRSEKDRIDSKEKTVLARLSSLLLSLFENFSEINDSGQKQLRVSISKADIARVLSVADETIIRTMNDLKNLSILDFSGKIIILLDEEKLRSASA